MPTTNTFKAKDITVPQHIIDEYDSHVDRNGHNFTSSLLEDGNIRSKDEAAIGMGFAQVMPILMKIEHDIVKGDSEQMKELIGDEKFSHGKIFEVLMTGIGLSYLLGNMKWHHEKGSLPGLVPEIGIGPEDYENIQFRGGGKANAQEVMAHLMQHMETEGVTNFYKEFFRYNPVTKEYSYKTQGKSGFVHFLMQVFKMVDAHIADAKHYKD